MPAWPVPGGYRLVRLLMGDASRSTNEEQLFVTRLLDEEPAIGIAIAWAKRMNARLRRKTEEKLDEVLDAASDALLGRFHTVLRRDFAAVNAATELP